MQNRNPSTITTLPFRLYDSNYVHISYPVHACYTPWTSQSTSPITLLISDEQYKLWSPSCAFHILLSPLGSVQIFSQPRFLPHPRSILFVVYWTTTPCCNPVTTNSKKHIASIFKIAWSRGQHSSETTDIVSKVNLEAGGSRCLRNAHSPANLKQAIIIYNRGVQPSASKWCYADPRQYIWYIHTCWSRRPCGLRHRSAAPWFRVRILPKACIFVSCIVCCVSSGHCDELNPRLEESCRVSVWVCVCVCVCVWVCVSNNVTSTKLKTRWPRPTLGYCVIEIYIYTHGYSKWLSGF